MKKNILVLIFIFVASFVYCQELHGELEYKYYTQNVSFQKLDFFDIYTFNSGVHSIKLDMNLNFSFFRFGGFVETFMLLEKEPISYFPHYTSYEFRAEVFIDNITLGYTQTCTHPVIGNLQVGDIVKAQYGHEYFYAKIKF